MLHPTSKYTFLKFKRVPHIFEDKLVTLKRIATSREWKQTQINSLWSRRRRNRRQNAHSVASDRVRRIFFKKHFVLPTIRIHNIRIPSGNRDRCKMNFILSIRVHLIHVYSSSIKERYFTVSANEYKNYKYPSAWDNEKKKKKLLVRDSNMKIMKMEKKTSDDIAVNAFSTYSYRVPTRECMHSLQKKSISQTRRRQRIVKKRRIIDDVNDLARKMSAIQTG